jgi:hypothetical protein
LIDVRIDSTGASPGHRQVPARSAPRLTNPRTQPLYAVTSARPGCDPLTLSKEIVMLKRIAILTGLVAVFGAHTALATPTLNLHGYPPGVGAPEASSVPRAADRSTVAHERGWESASRGRSPNASFTWNP